MGNEEVIRDDMEKTREALTDKLETLEKKLVGSVQEASAAVTETVTSVKETMHEGVETVKDAVDIPAHVQRHPWLMLGGSVLCGYVLANLLEGRKKEAPAPRHEAPTPKPVHSHGNGHSKRDKHHAPAPKAEAPAQSSLLSSLEPELRQLKGLALGVTLGTVREMVTEQVPPNMAGQLRDIIDAVTKKVGGEPIPSSDFEFTKTRSATSEPEGECGAFKAEQPRW